MDVDARLLRSFVVVADERHFGRAAARLHVSSPALSQQVRRLEDLVGSRLLDRDSRHVTLTEAGRALLPAAREVSGAAERASAVVARLRRAAEQVLTVGFMAASSQLLPGLRKAVAGAAPAVRLRTQRLEWAEQTTAVLDGRVDASFARGPVEPHGLCVRTVLAEPRVAGLPLRHPLAARDAIVLADIADETLVSSATATEAWRRFWHVDPRPDGRPVRTGPSVENTEEMLEVVASGAAICITAAAVPGYYRNPGVVFVPIVDVTPSEVVLCWAAGDERASVALLVRLVAELSPAPDVTAGRPRSPGAAGRR